jgi:hypothetical protein
VWNGQVNPAYRECCKLKPYLAEFVEYQESFFLLRQRLLDGRQVEAHGEARSLLDRMRIELSKPKVSTNV